MTKLEINVPRKRSLSTLLCKTLLVVVFLFFAPVGCMVVAHYSGEQNHWHSQRSSTDQAPEPSTEQAIIQVYAARAARWRGAIGVHTWYATKRTTETSYTRLEVIGYRLRWGRDTVRMRQGVPDAMWFGNKPTLLREIRGDKQVDALIDTLFEAADNYPYNNQYKVWPGPNSNTFVAHLARQVPQLRLELPPTAVGKDYLPGGALVGSTPSGTGIQLSLGGYFGLLAGVEEGLEVDLLGLTVGIDLLPPAIKLPGIGRIGFSDVRRVELDGSNP